MLNATDIVHLCPSCGRFVNSEDWVSRTGFCGACSKSTGHCVLCGSPTSDDRPLCRHHRTERWLAINADAVEIYMALGHSFPRAQELVRRNNQQKINCLSCGGFIQDSRSYFCQQTNRCKSARHRLRNLLYRKGVPLDLAIETILRYLDD